MVLQVVLFSIVVNIVSLPSMHELGKDILPIFTMAIINNILLRLTSNVSIEPAQSDKTYDHYYYYEYDNDYCIDFYSIEY